MKCSDRKNGLPCNQFAFAGPIHEGTELLDEVVETLGTLVEELVHCHALVGVMGRYVVGHVSAGDAQRPTNWNFKKRNTS